MCSADRREELLHVACTANLAVVFRPDGHSAFHPTATRRAMESDYPEDRTASEHEPFEEPDPLDELSRIVSETPAQPPLSNSVRRGRRRTRSIYFEGGPPARSRPFEALREASHLGWPSCAIGFRLIDRGRGRDDGAAAPDLAGVCSRDRSGQ
jgi:hypothetical protein